MSKKIDETGNRYGMLTVLYQAKERNQTGGAMWVCKCDCGKIIVADGHSMRRGRKKSCGCLRQIKNQIGNRYGLLTVEKFMEVNKDKQALWLCKCDCGGQVIVTGVNLRKGNTQSCGCLKSKGQMRISHLLTINNIPFEREKQFQTCRFDKTGKLAKFDFYINHKYIIEYDGIQHFQYINNSSKTWNTKDRFQDTKYRDNFKNQWCKNNNIPIIRIPYTHLKDLCIEDLKLETSSFILI